MKEEEEVEINKKWFQDTDEGYLIAVSMISEGAHYSGVNTIIMFRRTTSYLVYAQQLGRIITLTKKENPNAIVFDLVNNADNVKYNDRKINRDKKTHSVARLLEVIKKQAEKSNQIVVADETREIVDVIRKIKDYNQLRVWGPSEEKWLYDNYKNYDSRELAIIDFKGIFPSDKSVTQIKEKIKTMKLNLRLTSAQIRSLPVICVETGEIFESGKLAERIVCKRQNLKRCHVRECLKGRSKTAGGYHWKYIDEEENKPN